jgi:hypothetical protein
MLSLLTVTLKVLKSEEKKHKKNPCPKAGI